ncbi:hypothetical protein JTB14_030966 [Gonioctena quinquepunctata]|nr:hypothetical protein JTB14_030966 [Gonioctena quinquepunctata]
MDLCMMYREKLQCPKYKKKHIFKEISDVLLEKGHQFSPLQCENKLKTLITKYREICDHNNKTGNERKTWKFFEQSEECIGDKPNVQPVGKCSSLGLCLEIAKMENFDDVLVEDFLEDDLDVLDFVDMGYPRRIFLRPNYYEEMSQMKWKVPSSCLWTQT